MRSSHFQRDSPANKSDATLVRLVYPGHRTKIASRTATCLLLILLTILGFTAALPTKPIDASSADTTSDNGASRQGMVSSLQMPQRVGASPLPDLSLPHTVVSSLKQPVNSGGAIQVSPDNIIIYNAGVTMRLRGGLAPHDELLSSDESVLSSWMFWRVEVSIGGSWVQLNPSSNNFTIIGTNSTGTFVVRTMSVGLGQYSCTLRIWYEALSTGLLKWDLELVASTTGQYRLFYDWHDIGEKAELSRSVERLRVGYRGIDYTLSWDDVSSSFNSTATLVAGRFSLEVDLGALASGSIVDVDPTIASNVFAVATGFSFQRHVFYEPTGGYYFAFFYDGSAVKYSNSSNGVNWSAPNPMPVGWPKAQNFESALPTVFNSGQQVVVATGTANYTGTSAYVYYVTGTISGPIISWGNVQLLETDTGGSTSILMHNITPPIGIRYISVARSSDGYLAFSYNIYTDDGTTCNSYLIVKYKSYRTTVFVEGNTNGTFCQGDASLHLPSVILPASSQGGLRIVYRSVITYLSNRVGSDGVRGPYEILWTADQPLDFSAVSDADYGTHLVYGANSNGTINYAYHPSNSAPWLNASNIFGTTTGPPTITVDYSTNDVYALAFKGQSLIMLRKQLTGRWTDGSLTFVVNGQINPAYLSSNFASASTTNSSQISVLWTEGTGPYNASFASIPIQTVWSPYASLSDPWDGRGLAPYGQYFASLGEYVSPSFGMLTVRQTDLSIAGRGLDLALTRVYTEPYAFLNGSVYNYESYPWAPMGNGWQLNFPWMSNTVANATYIHLWDGEGYRIPSSFWTTGVFENHQGEHFVLSRDVLGFFIDLYTKSGTYYIFTPTTHALLSIVDATRRNQINFGYDSNNRIANVTDSVGRVFQFCYTNGLLSSIDQANGSCGNEANFVRRLTFSYSGQNLISVADTAGRSTNYGYGSGLSSNVRYWLLTRVTYPTGWYTNYSYVPFLLGTQAYTYRVANQFVGSLSNVAIRDFRYAYTSGPGDQVTNSTVTALDEIGGSLQSTSYTSYGFSFAGSSWNISDSHHNFVRGISQRFGVHGEVPREIVLVSPTMGYTNYYRYDLWGNLIYTRNSINSLTGSYHETFSAYYNDGLPPGFNALQDTFSENHGTVPDNQWWTQGGYWQVQSGRYNGTETSGNGGGTFAWADINMSDISLRANVMAVRQTNTLPGVGIFVHHTSSKMYKWSLILTNQSDGLQWLELVDESTRTLSPVLCAWTTGTWYTFSMTAHGFSVTGSVSNAGRTICSVTATFPSSSPAGIGTGFGLYANGYSALFDNVTATTIDPQITATDFSNSFYLNGGPSPNVYGALAGTAQLQNGTGSPPIESYYSYTSWGGLYQTKRLYNSISGTSWLTTSRTYDSYGNLKTLTDAKGNQTSYGYSGYQSAYLTSVNETLVPGGTLISNRYGYNFTVGTQTSSVDPYGKITTYRYDILGRVVKITYPTGDYQSFSYNDQANYANVTNENGWLTQQVYDGLGRLTNTERFSGTTLYSKQTITYNWADKISSQTDPMGNNVTYQYDALGRTTTVVEPNKNTIQTMYNDPASWIRTTDENGIYKCSVYNHLGRLLSVVENASSACQSAIVTNYSYDETGNLRRVTTSTSQSTSYAYDNLNRLISAVYPDGTSESYAYDPNGNLLVKYDRKGIQTSYGYDSLNRLTTVTYHGSTVTLDQYSYDNNGNLLQLQSQNATIAYTYDSRNRVLSETYTVITGFNITSSPASLNISAGSGGGSAITLTSVNGFSGTVGLSVSVPSGITVRLSQTNVPLAAGGSAASTATVSVANTVMAGTYTVTVTGSSGTPGIVTRSATITVNVIGFSMSLNPISVGKYCNPYGCPYSITNTSQLTINSFGGFSGTVWLSYNWPNPRGNTTVTGPLSLSLPANGSVSTTLNATLPTKANTDYLWKINGTSGTYNSGATLDVYYHVCTKNCPLIPVTGTSPKSPAPTTSSPSLASISYTISYAYNGELVNKTSYPDGLALKYTYDLLGRIITVSQSGSSNNYATFVYNMNDQPTTTTFGNGLVQSYGYDTLSRPTQITLKNGTSTTLSLAYSYYKTGTVAGVKGQVNGLNVTEAYNYDALQLLTNVTMTRGTSTSRSWFEYDTLGNRLFEGFSSNSGLVSYSYNPSNNELLRSSTYACILTICGSAPNSFAYDTNGQLRGENTTSDHWTYAWDVPGRLLKATDNGVTLGAYAYDGIGRRVESVEATTTLYAYTGTETLMEIVPGVAVNDYVYAVGLRIAKVSGTTISYYHEDALGSTRLVTDASKRLLFTDNYQPFGQDSPTGAETYRFTGRPYSQALGLYYDLLRWYDPSTGRFISQDPLAGSLSDPQSQNPYVYARNLPTVLTDPSGAGYGSDCHDSLCATPIPYYTGDLPPDVDPYVRDLCLQNRFMCPTILRYYGYGDDLEGEGITASDYTPASGTGGSPGSAEPGLTTATVSDATPALVDTPPTTGATENVEFLNPNAIRFTQDSVSPNFQNGQSITDLARGLESGAIDPVDVKPIRAVEYENNLYALDNRRLVAFQAANTDIPAIRVPFSGQYQTEFWDKYSPIYQGLKVLIRGVGIWPPNLP